MLGILHGQRTQVPNLSSELRVITFARQVTDLVLCPCPGPCVQLLCSRTMRREIKFAHWVLLKNPVSISFFCYGASWRGPREVTLLSFPTPSPGPEGSPVQPWELRQLGQWERPKAAQAQLSFQKDEDGMWGSAKPLVQTLLRAPACQCRGQRPLLAGGQWQHPHRTPRQRSPQA